MTSSLREFITHLKAQPETGDGVGNFDQVAQQFVDELRRHEPVLAIVVWLAEDDGKLRVCLERGLEQYANEGKFNVSAAHHRLLLACSSDGSNRTHTLELVGDGMPVASKMFPFQPGSSTGVLEIISAEPHHLEETEAIDEVGRWFQATFSNLSIHQNETQELAHSRLEPFLRLLYEQLSTRRVANVAATDGRVLCECDRISVLRYLGRRCQIAAISHVETVQRRSKLSRALRKLGLIGRRLPRPLVLEGNFSTCPENLKDALADYVGESRCHAIAFVPLIPEQEMLKVKHELAHRKMKPKSAIAMLIVEQFASEQSLNDVLDRVDLIKPHIARALANAADYESVFLLPLWRATGSCVRWLLGYPKAALAALSALAVAVCLILAITPATYRVHADGRALPAVQHDIFAMADGVVVEVFVTGGQRISVGDQLVALRNHELEIERVAVANEVTETEALIEALRVRMESARLSGDIELELAAEGELASAVIELEGAQRRLKLLDERLSRLVLVSRFDGVVTTFQPEQTLLGRPVQQGDLVLEVMDDLGPWRLELDIPEYRMGHVLHSANQHGPLQVRYIAMTDVSTMKMATLTDVATRSDHSEDLGAFVRAYAAIDGSDIPNRRIGAEVSAKIGCPNYSLFYAIFGDVVEFVQRNIWW